MIRLVVFDCDGTLVDSQHVIFEAVRRALVEHGQPVPPLSQVRAMVGLSLVEAIGHLLPETDEGLRVAIAASYRTHFRQARAEVGVQEPLFPLVRETLSELGRRGLIMAVATGKSRRGLDLVLAHHRLGPFFTSLQTADGNPSKPHPAMLQRALAETGSAPKEAILVGDTTFDVTMARSAGVRALGVTWGYHPPSSLERAGAARILARFDQVLEEVNA